MESGYVTMPFGRRPMSLGMLASQQLPETIEPGTAALETADLAVLVVPAEVRACAAAATVAARVLRYGVSLQLVVRGPAPGGLTPRDVSRALDIPLLAAMRPQPGLASALDRGAVPGRSRGPLATAAAQVLGALDGSGRALGRVA